MPALPRDLIMELMGAAAHGSQGRGALDPTKLREFLGGAGPNNQYLDIGEYNTYLRRGIPRQVERATMIRRPVDLANISRTDMEGQVEFNPEKFRNPKGRFKEMLAMLEEEALKSGYDSVYVENIFNKFLPDVLNRAGYNFDADASRALPEAPSMYKRLGGVRPGRTYF